MNKLKSLLFLLAAFFAAPAMSASNSAEAATQPGAEMQGEDTQKAKHKAKNKPKGYIKDPYPAQFFDLRTTLRVKVTLPPNYIAYSSEDKFIEAESDTIEYLPRGETDENWTSVFAISKQPGGFPLEDYFKIFVDEFKSITDENIVYEEKIIKHRRYTEVLLTLGFKEKGRPQVVHMRFLFAKKASVSVHYTTFVPENKSVNEVIEETKNMVNNSISFEKVDLTPIKKPLYKGKSY